MDLSGSLYSYEGLCKYYPAVPQVGCYKFRITCSYDESKSVIDAFFGQSGYLAVYEHESDEEVSRTHIHGFVCGFRCKSVKTFRKDIKEAFLEYIKDDKHDFAVGEIGPKPVEYCSKGRYDPKMCMGFDINWINYYKNTGYDGKKDRLMLKDGKIHIHRDIPKEVKPKNEVEMLKELGERCAKNDIVDPIDIMREILKVWDKNNKRGHRRLLKEWCDAVRYYNPKLTEKFLEEVANEYESDIMRGRRMA